MGRIAREDQGVPEDLSDYEDPSKSITPQGHRGNLGRKCRVHPLKLVEAIRKGEHEDHPKRGPGEDQGGHRLPGRPGGAQGDHGPKTKRFLEGRSKELHHNKNKDKRVTWGDRDLNDSRGTMSTTRTRTSDSTWGICESGEIKGAKVGSKNEDTRVTCGDLEHNEVSCAVGPYAMPASLMQSTSAASRPRPSTTATVRFLNGSTLETMLPGLQSL